MSFSSQAINARQIKAARALLEWSQEDLAQASGLSIATIRNVESGQVFLRGRTQAALLNTFEDARVVFHGPSGVYLRDDEIITLEGDGCFRRILEDAYELMKSEPTEIMFMNADSGRTTKIEIDQEVHLRKLGVRFRILIKEGDTYLNFPREEYRWVPESYFKYNVQVIYKDKVAFSVYPDSRRITMHKALIIRNKFLADACRRNFNFIWDHCEMPTHSTSPTQYD